MNDHPTTLKEFLALPTAQIAERVRLAGPQVCVFPINGTRRWFALEYGDQAWDDPLAAYMDLASRNHVGLYRLFFEHGIDTLVTPVLGADILTRGEEYMSRIGAEGYARLAGGQDFLDFYASMDVRVRFYGDYRTRLAGTPYAHLIDQFDSVAAETAHHSTYRLFLGAFADSSASFIGRLAVEYFQQHGEIPATRHLVEAYYGEFIEPASLFIGFDKFTVFDYPLLASGTEDLYFTVAPSPYLSALQLRTILYDHLVTRRQPEPEYGRLSAEARGRLQGFYSAHRKVVQGTGELLDAVWVPRLG